MCLVPTPAAFVSRGSPFWLMRLCDDANAVVDSDGWRVLPQGVEQTDSVGIVHRESGKFVGREPGDFAYFVAGVGLPGDDLAEEDEGNDGSVHVLVDAGEGEGPDLKAGFLADFSD